MFHNFSVCICHRCRLGGEKTFFSHILLFFICSEWQNFENLKFKNANKKNSDAVLQAFCFPLPSSYGIVFFTFAFYFISLLPIFSIAPSPLYKNDINNKLNNLKYELPSLHLSSLCHCLNYLLLPLSSTTFPSLFPTPGIFISFFFHFFTFCSCQTE